MTEEVQKEDQIKIIIAEQQAFVGFMQQGAAIISKNSSMAAQQTMIKIEEACDWGRKAIFASMAQPNQTVQ